MTDNKPDVVLLPADEGSDEAFNQPEITEEKVHSSATQITLKSGDAFLVANVRGDLLSANQATGLYWHGARFLRECNFFLEGQPLVMLSHHVSHMGNTGQVDLTNPTFKADANTLIEQGEIYVSRLLELHHEELIQTFTITSFRELPRSLRFSLKFGSDFCDLFEVRGLTREQHGQTQPTITTEEAVTLSYLGLDEVTRETRIAFSPATTYAYEDRIHWSLSLERGKAITIKVRIGVCELNAERFAKHIEVEGSRPLAQPTVQTDDYLFNRLLTRGMNDLMMLSTLTPYGYYPYAGIPWFCCPFGRDGLITCQQYTPWFPQVTRGTLAFLAAHQGTKVDDFTEEEPGKILHEMRMGEMANCREIPYIPYYGSIDVTPLFLCILGEYIRWTNDLDFLHSLWPHAQLAARWIADYGDRDGDGFIEYHRTLESGIANQGWKDSWDSASHSNGDLAHSPLALCEVQGYAFAAYQNMGYLARRLGHEAEARGWEQRASELQARFLQAFWWEEEQSFYMALDRDKRPCAIVTTNAGQCLWSGIVPQGKAQLVTERLMREDMFSGWGLRTLSTTAARYNPMSYHNGSVWPHDTAMVGAGFARYGRKDEAAQLLKGLYQASHYFEDARLPELFCGFIQREGFGPTRYPVACSPQAWATGAPGQILNELLGMHADAEHHRLILEQPTLPPWINTLELRDLYIGERRVHLRFTRRGAHTEVEPGEENEVELQIL
ncbi:glycogen debranching N-terminal domain-containing protein [Ktedonospora formicarum]|uniref:Amylo-alpha-1,6-glucosidase n=1 Tax=Ktedonospora formicarum TaxID=2778364 RepID=A0A8J3MPZ1_9CHLR|nr:glycogen debranching N-terminal domain-containing protein [Ktedonospora formicarum]GHO44322.1 amylo-alpha-1,6-glucosidase [Ktedonospora formicarum]